MGEENVLSAMTLCADAMLLDLKQNDSSYEDAFINTVYRVHGKVYDDFLGSFLKFEYNFGVFEAAEAYFELLKEKYPQSRIVMNKETRQLIRQYS